MLFQVLGPVEIARDTEWVPVRASKPRALLAVLLVRRNRTLDRDWLVETLWQDRPPSSAYRLLSHYVWRLRGYLPDGAQRLRTTPSGYRLAVDEGELDGDRFGTLSHQAREAARCAHRQNVLDLGRAALALWRGPAFADARDLPIVAAAARHLERSRLAVREALAEAWLAGGEPAAALAELEVLTAAEPFRESAWGLRLLAMAQSGQRAEALAAYGRLRGRWMGQLGVEPGHELTDIHRRILADDPVLVRPRVVPRQVPAAVRRFVGRVAERERLTRLAVEATAGRAALAVVTGTAGVGKTALAQQWAGEIAGRFPDGQLYANLRGFDPAGPPVDPGEAVRGFLYALAGPTTTLPSTMDGQVALYRSLLAGRRVLVVLDNARDSEQVRPLLPADGPGMTVVTSRNRLLGLIAVEAAWPVPLDLLHPAEAHDLLAQRIGTERLAADPDAVTAIVVRCARLPLALAVVAARAVTQPDLPLRHLADQLRDLRGLDALAGPDPTLDVRNVFSWSVRQLGPDAATLFRRLGLHPGPDVGLGAVHALAGTTAAASLAELGDAYLVTEPVPGRFALHDLLRAYAGELADAQDPAGERAAARRRLYAYYTGAAVAADRALDPHREPLVPDRPADAFDPAAALGWFGAEHGVLLAVIQQAYALGFDADCWRLAWASSTYLHRRGFWADWAATQEAAVAAARRSGDRPAEAYASRSLAGAYTRLRRYDDADEAVRRALARYAELRHPTGLGHTYLNATWLYDARGGTTEALVAARHAYELYRAADHPVGSARALNAIGWCQARLGAYADGQRSCHAALTLFEEVGDRLGQAATWDSLGYVYHHLGQHREATRCYRRALDLDRDLGDRFGEADTLSRLGDTHHAAGDPAEARIVWFDAHRILDGLSHHHASEVRAKIDLVGPVG